MNEDNILDYRQEMLRKADENIDRLEKYLKENPEALPAKKGNLIVPERLVDKGDEMVIRIECFGTQNAAFAVTQNCFGHDAVPEPFRLTLQQEGDVFFQDIKMKFDVPGNTKLELWVGGERIVRSVAVIEKGYMAVIPWIGLNYPTVNEQIHRYDIAGDYWQYEPQTDENPQTVIDRYRSFVENSHKYGDRVACFVNAKAIIPDGDTANLYELDYESQNRGLRQLDRQMRVLGFDGMELVASYTPDAVALGIMEDLGVKGLTSLCAWQNWQDGGWNINHCGVSNQPYYPAEDDFRRAGDKRKIMCFTMGSSSCNRNYSIFALDGCPSNIVTAKRYGDDRILHYNAQRFYDIFDGYVADSKNNEKLLTITIAIESFWGHMDWEAVNEMSIRYIVKKAATEKIVFTSAADVSVYHQKRGMLQQEAYFYQPDYYYGYHNCELPGRVDDRIEAVTEDYLAVVRRGHGLPMYFYDYTKPWDNPVFEDTKRSFWGGVNPDTTAPSECVPAQIYREDMTISHEIHDHIIHIQICSETAKDKMVTGVFDVPFAADFTAQADKNDVKIKKVSDLWTGNTHLFVDLGKIEAGMSEIKITINGTPREPVKAEIVKDKFAIMWFGEHAFIRSMDKNIALKVEMDAPDTAYVLMQNGEKVFVCDGKLKFAVNEGWYNEAPMLSGYSRQLFERNLENAAIFTQEREVE